MVAISTLKPTRRDDIVADILTRATAAASANKGVLTSELAEKIEREVRADWGGDRVFIPKRAGDGHSGRNSRIMRDYLNGERLALLERRYQITQRRILQIIKAK
jgi:Mor family transcriptional regulator